MTRLGNDLRRMGLANMINFGLYLLSFAANSLVVLTAPGQMLKKYVLIYNASSVMFSILLFIYFAKFASIDRSKLIILVASVIFLIVSPFIGIYNSSIFIYPGLLIFNDYLVTQSHKMKIVTGFRLLMIVSAIPFLLNPEGFSVNIITRVVFLQITAIILSFTAKDIHLLSVKSPIKFQIGNYIFYNGTLSLVAIVVKASEALRWWYLAIQIGLVLILKVLDFSLRRSHSLDIRTRWLAMIGASGIPLIALIFYPNVLALCLFYIGFFGLIFSGRYISN